MEINLRLATFDDCFDIWQWRNHPAVRKFSFNTDKISYESHLPIKIKEIEKKRFFDASCTDVSKLVKSTGWASKTTPGKVKKQLIDYEKVKTGDR